MQVQRLRKMAEVVSATNEPQAFSYAERIARKIKPNIVFVESTTGNPTAIVEIKCTEDGKIIGVRLAESSSNKSWDEAVLKAVVKSESIPLDSNGKIPNTLLISFRPKD
jgi:colicin import membrane protein